MVCALPTPPSPPTLVMVCALPTPPSPPPLVMVCALPTHPSYGVCIASPTADLNVLDWSSTGVLAVALRDTVYLLNKASGAIDQLSVPSSEYVSSLAWNKTGKYLALGTSNAEIQVILVICVCLSSPCYRVVLVICVCVSSPCYPSYGTWLPPKW